jgi:hypothetical protein
MTVLKPSESIYILETLGEGTADSATKVNPPSADSFEGEAYVQIRKLQLQHSCCLDYDERPL